MKWLAILVLLANLSLYLAYHNRAATLGFGYESNTSGSESLIPQLVLLSELPEPQITYSTPPSASDSVESDWCEVIGPFLDVQQLEAAQGKLVNAGFKSRPLQMSTHKDAQFWTYISPQGDRDTMLAILAMLRQNNIDGNLQMYGERIHTLSLKYFVGRAEAEEFLEHIAKLGVKAEVVDLKEETRKLWLKVPRISGRSLPAWVNHEYPHKKTLKDNCDKVANSAKFH